MLSEKIPTYRKLIEKPRAPESFFRTAEPGVSASGVYTKHTSSAASATVKRIDCSPEPEDSPANTPPTYTASEPPDDWNVIR